jgi:hypothetical protein
VPLSCACAAFQVSAGLKGMWGAVWCTTVKVDIQKWYPSHGISLVVFWRGERRVFWGKEGGKGGGRGGA